jgi:geranylgeranyl reductase family protein
LPEKYDAIVVGAGPAGASAAYLLARAGHRVALVDKTSFPRDKLCGGGLTVRSKKAFERIFCSQWNDILEYKSAGLAFYYKKKFLNSLENYQSLHFIYRCDFDHYLVKKAQDAGAELIENFRISEIDSQNHVIHEKSGRQLQADFIIGADGIKSVVARQVFGQEFDRNKYAIAMEAEVSRDQFKRHVTLPEIYYGSIKWGYGWVFPKKDKLTIGIAGLYKHNDDIKSVFHQFLEQDLGLPTNLPMKGYYLPFGEFQQQLEKNNFMLIGDAAGLVDPITGEGIAFAMESGEMAAESIIKAVQQAQPQIAGKLYQLRVERITNTIRQANKIKLLIYPKFFNKILIKGLATSKNKNSIRYYLDLMADDITYYQYLKLLFWHSGKRVFKLMFTRKALEN